MAGAASRIDRNLPILRARFDLDLHRAVAQVESRLTHLFSGALSFLNPLAKSAFHHVGIPEARKRVEIQFAIHERAAREVPTLGLAAAIERHLPDVLRHDDFLARVHHEHAAFPEARLLVEEGFRTRLPAIAKLLHDAEGATFEELARSVLARPDVEETLAAEFAVARRLMDLAEEREGFVRAPRAMLPKVVAVGRDLLAWYERYSESELDRIYGAAMAGLSSRAGPSGVAGMAGQSGLSGQGGPTGPPGP